MKLALGLLALLLVTACGADAGESAVDPANGGDRAVSDTPTSVGPIPDDATTPTSHPSLEPGPVPAADGPVRTRIPATVLDAGHPELCLGPVSESFPPQCSGIPLLGWDWTEQPGHSFETRRGARWGQYVVIGTFDGQTMTASSAAPAGDRTGGPDVLEPTGDAGSWQPGQQQDIQDKLAEHPLPGTVAVHPTPAAVVVDVVHDDGTIQARADEAYGAGLVQVRSMLVPVER